jgi:N-acetylglucosamine kinase-like BadF-type ATPase
MMYVLGIDVGATKTVCLLADDAGRVLATAREKGANLQAVGELELEKALHSVMKQALSPSGASPAAICLGIAGVDRAEDELVVRSVMERIGYQARILVVNDALIALQAALDGAPGVVIVAGTGSIAYGRNGQGQAARAGGWGHMLGDEGSGYWIGRLVLRAVVRAADGRGQQTALTPLLLQHFSVDRAEDLIQKIYQRDVGPAVVAGLARYAQEAQETGDAIATQILERAAEELVAAAAAVTRRLRLTDEPFQFVMAGGMFRAVPWLRPELMRLLPAVAPRATCMHLQDEPALGAVRLAVAELKGGAKLPVSRSA